MVTLGGAGAEKADEGAPRPDRVRWSSLTMKASKFGLSTESTVELRLVPARDALSELLSPPDGIEALTPRGGSVVWMEVRSDFLGLHSSTRFWLDAETGQAFQWIVVESGKRERYKASRALSDGVWVLRKNPARKSEEGKPHSDWTKVRDRVEPFVGLPPGEALSESAGLFYVLATAPLKVAGDRIQVYLQSDGKVFPVEIQVEREGKADVSYVRSGPGGERRVEGKVPGLLLSMRPLVPEGMDRRDFEFIGLEGDVDVWLDPEGRYPLEVSGKVAYAGKVRIRLRQAVLETD